MSVYPNSWRRYLLAAGGVIVVVAAWVSLFTAGITIDSEYYRREVSPAGGPR